MTTFSILTTTHFAEEYIADTLIKLRKIKYDLQQNSDLKVNLIFVDDGSTDNTVEILKKEQIKSKDFFFIKLSKNFGSIYSHLAGFEYANSLGTDGILHIASDMQEPPELIPKMVAKWLSGEKFVICVRKTRQDPLMTKFFAWLYYKLFTKFALKDFPKKGFDMMLLDKQVLDIFLNCNEKNYTPQQLIFWLGFKPSVIEYHRQKRSAGKSTWTFSKKIKLAIDTFVSMSYFPIRFMSSIGLTIAALSFMYGIFIIFSKLFGDLSVPGWASITVLLTFLFGLNMVMLGVIGEYLWRVLDQVKGRPRYVIDYTLKAKNTDEPIF